MSSDLVQHIPWSVIQPDPKTMMNHYLSQYIDKLSFDFVYEIALPIGRLAVVTGVVTTVGLYYISYKTKNKRLWAYNVIGALGASMGLVFEYAAVRDLGMRVSLTNQIKFSLQQFVVWKALSNNIAAERIEAYICELFTQVAVLNGPKISERALAGSGGFWIATIIYIFSKKSANPKYLTKADTGTHTVFWILAGNLIVSTLFNTLIQKEVIFKTIIRI